VHVVTTADLISKSANHDETAVAKTAQPSMRLNFRGAFKLARSAIERHYLTARTRPGQQVHQVHCGMLFEGGKNSSLPHAGTTAHSGTTWSLLPGPQPAYDVDEGGFHQDVVALIEFDGGGAVHAGSHATHVNGVNRDLLAIDVGEHAEFWTHSVLLVLFQGR
jgi:hypothetical protein